MKLYQTGAPVLSASAEFAFSGFEESFELVSGFSVFFFAPKRVFFSFLDSPDFASRLILKSKSVFDSVAGACFACSLTSTVFFDSALGQFFFFFATERERKHKNCADCKRDDYSHKDRNIFESVKNKSNVALVVQVYACKNRDENQKNYCSD
jgi:hypothetical protein